ncbi:hypothetical protein E8E12_003366 [Didymella heteroderae]|uniref:Uncharacterized protein n=1 Tax=Didymella heteroderae TaxID=1769908 RepID=A0A9P4WK37_9PLEO|nr:hypothetical protein E8E12_003366 [Didymella heteroderae]
MGHSPMHVMSPMSNRSRSSTPVQVAPIVPSILPAAQRPLASQNAPMDSLNALRSHKASLAVSVAQANGGATIQEVKLLQVKLKAAELRESQFRSELKILETQLKQFQSQSKQWEALPAQLAALKYMVEQQQHAAAKGPSPEDVGIRLSALENAKPAIEISRFEELQSDVQGLTTRSKKLDRIPDQLVQLQAIVAQHGEEVAEATSSNNRLKTEVLSLTSLREEVRTIKEEQPHKQALHSNSMRAWAREEMGPDVVRLNAALAEQRAAIQQMSSRVDRSQRTVDDVSTRVEAKPRSIENTTTTTIQASQSTSDELRAQKLNRTRKHPIDTKDLHKLREVVAGIGEDNEKLAKELQEIRVAIGTPPLQNQVNAAVRAQTGLSLEEHEGTYHEEQVILSSQQKAFQTEQSRLSEEQTKQKETSESLESRLATSGKMVDQLSKTQNEFKETFQTLESRVTVLDKTVDQVKVLANTQTELSRAQRDLRMRITALETAPVRAVDKGQSDGNDHANTVVSSSRIDGLENRLRSVEDHIGGLGGLSTRCDQLHDDMKEVNEDIEDCQNKMGRLIKSITEIFEETFDPFKKSVEERLMEHASNLTQTHETLISLQGKFKESQKECPAATFSAPQLELIQNMVQGSNEVKQDLSRLRDSVHMESEQRNAAIEDLKQQLAIKQDATASNNAIDAVRHSLRTLTNQYENITTDDLHQKMVHWFMQNYGHASANLLQHVPAIQHELKQLRNFTDVVTRIPNSAQTLSTLTQLEPQLRNLAQLGPQLKSLAQLGPQLTALAQSPPSIEGSHPPSAKTSESLESMKTSVAKAHQQYESLAKVVSTLQTSVHSLTSNKTPFAKAESLTALEKLIATLRVELKASIDEGLLQNRKEFETKPSKEHDQRWHAEESIKKLVWDCSKKVNEEVSEREKAEREMLSNSDEKFKELEMRQKTSSDHLEKLQKVLDQLQSDLDKALDDFNDPKNKEAIAWLPTLFLHVGQLQWVLEILNQNLPKGGLDIEWTSDWRKKFHVPSPLPKIDEAASRGKGKRQA